MNLATLGQVGAGTCPDRRVFEDQITKEHRANSKVNKLRRRGGNPPMPLEGWTRAEASQDKTPIAACSKEGRFGSGERRRAMLLAPERGDWQRWMVQEKNGSTPNLRFLLHMPVRGSGQP